MTDASLPTRKRASAKSGDRETDLSNYLVPPAMLVVAIAMGVASNLHLGADPEMAIAVGAGMFCAMLLCHVLLHAADIADKAAEAAEERRVEKVASPMPAPDRIVTGQLPSELLAQEATGPEQGHTEHVESAPQASSHSEAGQRRAQDAEFGRGLGALAGHDAAGWNPGDPLAAHQFAVNQFSAEMPDVPEALSEPPLSQAPAAFMPQVAGPVSVPPTVSFPGHASDVAMAPPSPASPAGWLFRPVELRVPAVETEPRHTQSPSEAAAVVAAIGALRPTIVDQAAPAQVQIRGELPGHGEPASADADRIDQILKRLAHQIKSGTVQATADEAHPVDGGQAAAQAAIAQTDPETLAALAGARPDTALESAVDALRSTVEAMRQGSSEPETAAPVAATVPPNPVEARIAAIADALAAERVDVVLAPILALEGAEARHFEVSVRLRSASGDLIDARSVASGAGLLPLLDALNVRHAAGFALNLDRRGRSGAVFSTVAGESLESDGFVGDVAGRYAQGIANRMVLSFAQAEMRGLGPAQIAALGELADLGFRFALTGVADLDMDFDALKATGFQFVKLDAAIFLGGLPCGGSIVPASDLCLHFADTGIEVIVSGIGDERQRDNLLGCGVAYGQGPLYGDPRPIPFAAGGAIAA